MRGLAFALDDNYLIGFLVLWESLMSTDSVPPETPVFLLHEDTLSQTSRDKVQERLFACGFKPTFLLVSDLMPGDLPIYSGEHVSRATFYRLFVHQLIPNSIDSLVYLDSDLLALKSCEQLFHTPLLNPIAAADHCAPKLSLEFWGESGGNYFQAGVLLLDLQYWREHRTHEVFTRILLQERQRIKYWDQDVLNLAFQDSWQRLPIWFNVGQDAVNSLPANLVAERTVIAHFDNPYKPWNSRTTRPFAYDWDLVCLNNPYLQFLPPKRGESKLEKLIRRVRKFLT